MKLSIEGFSQAYAATLKAEEKLPNGSTKEVKIDCTDLVILRWFADFFPSMKKERFEDGEYAWLVHSKLKEDLPLLDITPRACRERMQKLAKFKLLKYRFIKNSQGTFSYYSFGENYMNLLRADTREQDNTAPCTSEGTPRRRSNAYPIDVQTHTKDESIKDESIKDELNLKLNQDNKDLKNQEKEITKKKNPETLFDRFWQVYPKKVSKGQAEKTWNKLDPDEALTEKIIEAVETAKRKDSRFRDQRYTPHPSTWLNGREWENEYEGGDGTDGNHFNPTAGGRHELPDTVAEG